MPLKYSCKWPNACVKLRRMSVRHAPAGMPKFCMDSKAAAVMSGVTLPSQTGTPNEHHALVDARWGKLALEALGVPFCRFDPDRDYDLPSSEGAGPSM